MNLKQHWEDFGKASRNPIMWLCCISWCLMGFGFGWMFAFPHNLTIDIGENMMSAMPMVENLSANVQKQFDDKIYFLGLARGCDNGCLQATALEYNLTGQDYFEDFNSTPLYPPCVSYCMDAYGSDRRRD